MKVIGWIIGILIVGGAVLTGWYLLQNSRTVDVIETEIPAVSPASPVPTRAPAPIGAGGQDVHLSVEATTLRPVGSYTGSGTATRVFDGGTFAHTVTAAIPDPADGKFFEGWLVMTTAEGSNFFSTGKLTKQNNIYSLAYTAAQDFPNHKQVVVTEETEANGLDGVPEVHVLEGDFGS